MKTTPKKKTTSLSGYLIFFSTIAAAVTIGIVLYKLAERASNGSTAVIAICTLLVIVLLSLACTGIDILRRRIMIDRPVSRILAATERIARGDFSVRLSPAHGYESHDDYDLIMENLNAVATELGKSEMLKADFISNLSHELKTPLSIIRVHAAPLADASLPPETVREYVKIITDATERLATLITNILKLNRLENTGILPEKSLFRLDDLLADCILAFEDAIERKSLCLTCELDGVAISSVPTYLEIIFNNLLSNAVKFTEPGGELTVTLQYHDGRASVCVRDSGCGISKETGAHIFDKFYQGDTSHASEGNGLGLPLVKTVLDQIGGEIKVESEPGHGSAFTVTLHDAQKETES